MKRCLLVSALSALLAVALPLLLPMVSPRSAGAALPLSEAADGSVPGADAEALRRRADAEQTVTLLRNGAVTEMTLEDYLPGVLAGEMPAGFEEQALRAQAVAARTYALYHLRQGSSAHPAAAVCDDPACCQVWLDDEALRALWGDACETNIARIEAAVAATDGEILTWGGEPILACFHASSAGTTETSAALWGVALPYLTSVESPETAADVPNFVSTVEVSPEDFRETILSVCPGSEITETLPPDWLGTRTLDTSGRVAGIRIGGVSLSGAELRSLFGLRSACFTLEWTGRSFLFTVTGSGHGVGMSQYGANVMARNGATWREILSHYYPGAEPARLTA